MKKEMITTHQTEFIFTGKNVYGKVEIKNNEIEYVKLNTSGLFVRSAILDKYPVFPEQVKEALKELKELCENMLGILEQYEEKESGENK